MNQKRNDLDDKKTEEVVDKCDNAKNIVTRYPLD